MFILTTAALGLVMGCMIYFCIDNDRVLNWSLVIAGAVLFIPISRDLWMLAKLHLLNDFRVFIDMMASQTSEADVWARIGAATLAYVAGVFAGLVMLKRSENAF